MKDTKRAQKLAQTTHLPDLSKFYPLLCGEERSLSQNRVCIVAFYSVIPGCFASIENV